MKRDMWVDYGRTDADGLTHANVADAAAGVTVEVGRYLLVGDEDADPAVAEVVALEDNGVVLVRVLPGPAEDHLHLIESHQSG